MTEDRIKSLDELLVIRKRIRENRQKLVWTNGCFDLLHVGHARYLSEAKKFGDVLIVGLNSDESVRKIKGPERPINCEEDRATLLSLLKPVDYVLIFNEETCCNQLRRLQPDFYVKGGDYTIETINQEERRIVEKYGGQIKITSPISGKSTTLTINKIQNSR